MAVVPVSFRCTSCQGIITLGVEGGREALTSVPPCCLYCGHPYLEDTDQEVKNGTVIYNREGQ